MDQNTLVNGLISYLGLVGLLTFHEFGHAWTAWKCGDDTAKLQGRVSLNPLVHIDLIGTVLLPLLGLFLPGAGRFLIGWAKPVPVNLRNLPHPRRDDVLITLAGPLMNLLLAIVLMALARVGMVAGLPEVTRISAQYAELSLLLCFFNLIPIPPLDGSRILRVIVGLSYETYYEISRYGIFILILVLQVPQVRQILGLLTGSTWVLLGRIFGLFD